MKLTNKDKYEIKCSLFNLVDNILISVSERGGYNQRIEHIPPKDIADYCYKVIGLYPTTKDNK